MGLWGRYAEYIKKNPEGYWFKRKLYGWGWTPATWQGWLTTAVFLAVFTWMLVCFSNRTEPSDAGVLWFVGRVWLWAGAFIFVCWKTGEPPKWQWGVSEDKKESLDEQGSL